MATGELPPSGSCRARAGCRGFRLAACRMFLVSRHHTPGIGIVGCVFRHGHALAARVGEERPVLRTFGGTSVHLGFLCFATPPRATDAVLLQHALNIIWISPTASPLGCRWQPRAGHVAQLQGTQACLQKEPHWVQHSMTWRT
jgi:hypothetical protein